AERSTATGPLNSSGLAPEDTRQACVSAGRDSGAISKEYGNAPSAFRLAPKSNASAISVRRGFKPAARQTGRIRRQCVVERSLNRQILMSSRFVRNTVRPVTASRAFGLRAQDVRRLRTRSPPPVPLVANSRRAGWKLLCGFQVGFQSVRLKTSLLS